MNVPTTIPVTLSPEAEAHVQSLGLSLELEQMLEHAVQTMTGLRRIEVLLEPPNDTGDEDSVYMRFFKDPAHYVLGDPDWDRWSEWKITSFPPDVVRHFSSGLIKDADHAG
jgi:hypothetical protein